MIEELGYQFQTLPQYLGGHILLSLAALALAILISVPLGILASRRPKFAESMLGVAGIVQTIPTLALLALMVPLLGGLIGFVPAFVALTLYGILPILAGTITGIRGVDPALIEAAQGLGMSETQVLTRVQLPLAAPVIIAGIRTATVLVVGTATLALPVGGLSLGNYIFSGLAMNNTTATVFGCVFTAVLAIAMDQLVHVLELAVQRRSRRLAWWGVFGFALVLAIGSYSPIRAALAPPAQIVGTANFTEQFILSEVIKGLLTKADLNVDQRQGMGETIQFAALRHNQIDIAPNYDGNIWVTMMHQKQPAATDEEMYGAVCAYMWHQHQVKVLGKLGFQNNYVLAVPSGFVAKHGITTISDLARHKGVFRIAGDEQFFNRPESRWLSQKYGLVFKEVKQMDISLVYDALEQGHVDVICAYSSDGRIKRKNQPLTILIDDRKALPKYNAILLASRRGLASPELLEAVMPLIEGRIEQDMMESANRQVDVSGASPREAARGLLEILVRRFPV